MTSYVFMWEDPDGSRKWEAIKESQIEGFLKDLLDSNVHPSTILVGYNPMLFHWVFPSFHKGLSDVFFGRIEEEFYQNESSFKSKHTPVNVAETRPKEESKLGWIAPYGKHFTCGYGEHAYLASKIVGGIEEVFDPEKHLERLGWAKIFTSIDGRNRYVIGMGKDKKLTDQQIKTLQRENLDTADDISFYL